MVKSVVNITLKPHLHEQAKNGFVYICIHPIFAAFCPIFEIGNYYLTVRQIFVMSVWCS
jgi:hypothetical protein